MSIIRFRSGVQLVEMTLTLGQDLVMGKNQNCRFIKVTRKGFNILNLDTNRTLLKKHVYMKGMGSKEFPNKGPITGKFRLPFYCSFALHTKEKAG